MPGTGNPLENVSYRRAFPWLHLTRAFWIAVDIRKLALAAAALLLLAGGDWVIDRMPFAPPREGGEEFTDLRETTRWPWQQSLGYDLWHDGDTLAEVRGGLQAPWRTLQRIGSNWQIVLRPVLSVMDDARVVFRADATWPELAHAVTSLGWTLLVWSIFGGAIGRMAAVQFARDQNVGVRGALWFALQKLLGYVSAPLLPLLGVGILWFICVIGGWIGRIPGGVGETILGVLWGLELVLGFLMAVVLVGLAAGWPLMFATIGVEGTDGFDGLSRAYNYVFERPLYFLWLLMLAMLYGSLLIFFVWLMGQTAAVLSAWGVSWSLGLEGVASLTADRPPLLATAPLPLPAPDQATAKSLGGWIVEGWLDALATLIVGFIYSYFWTAGTIVYFILRRSVDANDFDEVFVEDEQERDDLLPLVGTAAMAAAGKSVEKADAATKPVEPPVDLTP